MAAIKTLEQKKPRKTTTSRKKSTDQRREIAQRVAHGLAGWFQLQAALGLEGLSGEDSARYLACQVLQATGRYNVKTGQRPTNWPNDDKKRVDVAILGRNTNAKGWYGALEAKWPGSSVAVKLTRLAIVQDCIRLATVQTSNLNATLLVLGGSDEALGNLFDKAHRKQADETRRAFFAELLPRTDTGPSKKSLDEVYKHFAEAADRVPKNMIPTGSTRPHRVDDVFRRSLYSTRWRRTSRTTRRPAGERVAVPVLPNVVF